MDRLGFSPMYIIESWVPVYLSVVLMLWVIGVVVSHQCRSESQHYLIGMSRGRYEGRILEELCWTPCCTFQACKFSFIPIGNGLQE